MRTFGVAPQAPLITLITGVVLAIPVIFVGLAWQTPLAAPSLLPTAALVTVGIALVWVFARPSRFELDDDALVVRWPGRSRRVARADVRTARVFDHAAFRRTYGVSLRFGVGGLFGTFGALWTTERSWLDAYATNMGPYLVLELAGRRPLLLTPEDPEALRKALGAPEREETPSPSPPPRKRRRRKR